VALIIVDSTIVTVAQRRRGPRRLTTLQHRNPIRGDIVRAWRRPSGRAYRLAFCRLASAWRCSSLIPG
jgi:hypothetical protein